VADIPSPALLLRSDLHHHGSAHDDRKARIAQNPKFVAYNQVQDGNHYDLL
jgi:hypothetical protein